MLSSWLSPEKRLCLKLRPTVTLAVLAALFLDFSAPGFSQEAKRKIVFAQGVGGNIAVLDIESGEIARIPVAPLTHGVGVLPDGSRAYSSSFASDAVYVADLRSRKEIARINVGGRSHHIAVSPDGRWVYAAVGSPSAIAVIDARKGVLAARIPVTEGPLVAVFKSDGVSGREASLHRQRDGTEPSCLRYLSGKSSETDRSGRRDPSDCGCFQVGFFHPWETVSPDFLRLAKRRWFCRTKCSPALWHRPCR